MKIKSNVRAGKDTVANSNSKQKSSSINNTVVSFIPSISRCVGI